MQNWLDWLIMADASMIVFHHSRILESVQQSSDVARMPEQFAAIAEAIRNHDEEAAVTGLRNHSADFIKTVQAAIDESSRVTP